MNAQEVKQKGIEYCNKHRAKEGSGMSCIGVKCPLADHLCIRHNGEIEFSCAPADYVKFANDYYFMLKEIYKEQNNEP